MGKFSALYYYLIDLILQTVYFDLVPVDRETLRVRGGDNRPAVNTMLEQSMENIFQ